MADQVAGFVQYGALGVTLTLALLSLRVLYNERNAEAAARVADAKAYAETLLKIQERILAAVDKLSELYDEKKRGG